MDKSLQELLSMTARTHVNISATSSSFAKLGLIRQLLIEADKMNVDDDARMNIKRWLEDHQNKIEGEK